jgi:hypothetical protein
VLVAKALARRAGSSHSGHFRQMLKDLCQHGFLERMPLGYRRVGSGPPPLNQQE